MGQQLDNLIMQKATCETPALITTSFIRKCVSLLLSLWLPALLRLSGDFQARCKAGKRLALLPTQAQGALQVQASSCRGPCKVLEGTRMEAEEETQRGRQGAEAEGQGGGWNGGS